LHHRIYGCYNPKLDILGSTIFKSFKISRAPGCEAAGRIPKEFANPQLGVTDAGMYSEILFSEEIDIASRLFCAHSADLVKSY
jgi:hypothetical protein